MPSENPNFQAVFSCDIKSNNSFKKEQFLFQQQCCLVMMKEGFFPLIQIWINFKEFCLKTYNINNNNNYFMKP